MFVSEAESFIGKIVTLDMMSQIRLTTKIEAVTKDDKSGCWQLVCGPLLVFVMEVVGQNQQSGALEVKLSQVIPYGIPEMVPQKKNSIALNHVMLMQVPNEGIVSQYSRATSSIVIAPANTQLPDLGALGSAMSKITGPR